MTVSFPSNATPGDPMQLAINLRGELVQSIFVAPAPRLKQLGDLMSEGVVHPNLRGRRCGNCVNITPPGGQDQVYPRKLHSDLQVSVAILAIWGEGKSKRLGEHENRAPGQRRDGDEIDIQEHDGDAQRASSGSVIDDAGFSAVRSSAGG